MFFALRREGDRKLVAPLSIENPIKLGFWGEGRSGNRRIQSKSGGATSRIADAERRSSI
jgi:hypothetical protein